MSLVLLIHVFGAVLGLLSGVLSIAFRKGSGLHGAAGTVFFVSMLAMSASAVYSALFLKPERINVVVGMLTFYLVSTAWRAARVRDGRTGAFDVVAMLFVTGVGVTGYVFGFQSRAAAAIFFVFGSIAFLCAFTDVRMLRRGGVVGRERIARHLWRMCLALLIAVVAFYPGQAKLFPPSMRSGWFFVPHLFVVVTMIFWRIRYKKGPTMKPVLQSSLLLCILLAAAVVSADENPLSADTRQMYRATKYMLLRSAEKMPEEHYGFRPVETVRTYGQIVGHVADAQYRFCSAVLGEKPPAEKIEKTKASKAELVDALKEAFAYCDKAYDALTDVNASEMMKRMSGDAPRMGILSVNTLHTIEHYGNLVTYMRMKDVVPPTSEPDFMKKVTQ